MPCAICKSANCTPLSRTLDWIGFDCSRCGKYSLTDIALADNSFDDENKSSILSHWIRKNQNHRAQIRLKSLDIQNIVKSYPLPSVLDIRNNLIIYLGTHLKSFSDVIECQSSAIAAEIGVRVGKYQNEELDYIRRWTITDNLAEWVVSGANLRLTPKGWHEYSVLQKQVASSRIAFMAMKFTTVDDPLNDLVESYFKPAIAFTGFKLLNPLLHDPKAGNIDARLEVEIRNSRFLIADLTHDNSGAYWEAGFAMGLGKPVIYTCQTGITPHFDTNHYQTIFWEVGKEQEAADKLKYIVRATLPGEARLQD